MGEFGEYLCLHRFGLAKELMDLGKKSMVVTLSKLLLDLTEGFGELLNRVKYSFVQESRVVG